MALTSEQEGILEEIIDAYENGKRLSDLPESTNTNPQELLVEVLDNGESKKARLADLLPYSEEDTSYGIQRSIYDSSPTCTRIGNMDLHKTLPVQSLMRGCLLDDDGNVVEYLPDQTWEGATLDGTKGQVMVELPMHYRKCKLYDDGTMEVRLSLYPLKDYEQVPKMYVGAYQATVQRSVTKLCSVKNDGTDYRGGNNNADYDGTDMTFLGRPASGISAVNFLNYARNRGAAGLNDCGWNSYLYQAHKALTWFFVVEYATLNSQADYNAELTEEGYHQGGLSNGATNINSTSWSEWNGTYPFIPCGWTDSLGNHTGVVGYTLPDSYGSELTMNVNRYRGVENPFGHLRINPCDLLVISHPYSEESADALNDFYVCYDPSKFSGTSVDDYSFIGSCPGGDSGTYLRVQEILFGASGETICKAGGGSSTTYFCDSMYTANHNISADTIRVVVLSGNASDNAYAGFFDGTAEYTPTSTNTGRGSRLCFLPSA